MEGYETFPFPGGAATARRDVLAAVRAALAQHPTLHAWAAAQHPRETFHGRGEAYGVPLGPVRAVVRHAHRGGLLAPVLGDLYAGRPRFLHEMAMAARLAAEGIPTPAVLAGIRYAAGPLHRADVATLRADAADLAALLFGDAPPAGDDRDAVLRAVGRLVRALHAAGLVHPDLQLRNVLVTPPPRRAILLDVDTVREEGGAAARRANLARFYRSWAKWDRRLGPRLTARDRAGFEAGYAEAAP